VKTRILKVIGGLLFLGAAFGSALLIFQVFRGPIAMMLSAGSDTHVHVTLFIAPLGYGFQNREIYVAAFVAALLPIALAGIGLFLLFSNSTDDAGQP
jgi:hypothetical protein